MIIKTKNREYDWPMDKEWTIFLGMYYSIRLGTYLGLNKLEAQKKSLIKQFDESIGLSSKSDGERQEKFNNYKKEQITTLECLFSKEELDQLTLKNWILAMISTARSLYGSLYTYKGRDCYEFILVKLYRDHFERIKNEPEIFFKMS